ncbi:MAG: tRNA lysidine(34) synthetase TilS [Azospirillum sp.]|nr:tRNA lysidine(34) synthetase TilS [Azospirillum sp.]
MTRLGRFEQRPRLAAAVSGGADSLALVLLLHGWARDREGAVTAVTVDHGLRPDSAEEARRVGAWLALRGISHRILTWCGPKPVSGIQAAARAARYRLLFEYCRDSGILHLAVAHHLEDQAETLLMRLAHGSGVDGLAAMATVRERGPVRLIRPLLDQPKARLAATCRAAGLPWLDDPSNRNPDFARGRLRGAAVALGREGLTAATLGRTARRAGHSRAALDRATAALLGRVVTLYPEGWLRLAAAWRSAPEEIALRALGACLACIGGSAHPPRRDPLERLAQALRRDLVGAQTLAGCRIVPARAGWLIVREPAAVREVLPLASGAQSLRWDRRFELSWDPHRVAAGTVIARLGESRRSALRPAAVGETIAALPGAVRPSLPALWNDSTLIDLPDFGRAGTDGEPASVARFTPTRVLTNPSFVVV